MTVREAFTQFLFHCQYEKNLSPKTLKAYSIDLRQFGDHLEKELGVTQIDKVVLRSYIKSLFGHLAEKRVKRKVATLKALFHHLEREDEIAVNPFRKIDVRIKEKNRLPRTIPLAAGSGSAPRAFWRERWRGQTGAYPGLLPELRACLPSAAGRGTASQETWTPSDGGGLGLGGRPPCKLSRPPLRR